MRATNPPARIPRGSGLRTEGEGDPSTAPNAAPFDTGAPAAGSASTTGARPVSLTRHEARVRDALLRKLADARDSELGQIPDSARFPGFCRTWR